jgi:hypothetical protein
MILGTQAAVGSAKADADADFFGAWFASTGGDVASDAAAIAFRLALSGALGAAVAGFYLLSTRRRPRTPGLAGTLVLLAMLITFTTLAVGGNAAKAFTLVGTLAIVRFRTPVRDIRDTAFVIFAVADGLAVGAFAPLPAFVGTLVVGAASVLVGLGAQRGADDNLSLDGAARLQVRCDGPGAGAQGAVESALDRHARGYKLLETRDGRDGGLKLLYAVIVDRDRAHDLVHAVQVAPSVTRAALSFGEPPEDD